MIRQVRAALLETPTIELRLDWLKSDDERAKVLKWIKRRGPRKAIFIATCRRVLGGGKLRADARGELHWLIRAREAGCAWCDVEFETIRELPDRSVREYAVPLKVLLSKHDFQRTPRLPRKVRLSRSSEADAVKIATFARNIGDSLRLLRLARRSPNLVVVPMGEVGLHARILALREGSALTYAPVTTETAPGQVSLREMMHVYRAQALTRRTSVYGVIGDPIQHSLSPLLHNTGFIESGMDAVFLPFLVRDLYDFLRAVPEMGIRGFSVTIPHKQAILKHLDECDTLATQIGAVNTVVVQRDGSLLGYNTDHLGVLRALEKKICIRGSRILIFGAGGSARSAAFALTRAGAAVLICARREAAARSLARAAGGEAIPHRTLRRESFDAILNATPVGMYPNVKGSPLSSGELNSRLVMDFVYRPLRTHLLQMAKSKGLKTVSGLEMFLAQGFAQWELWTGQRPPEEVMRRAVVNALQIERRKR
jgi:3-dehydroquinate dehydratase / shikimate dehydrogenase